ncbi:MAG: EthD family reductase [Chloroflexi bacterium]|nr:EthD family reductase [Chloroflexota bacterium]MCH8349953.1 EthD family reductase [Chloroflexota bacterium]MCI0779705.1 EthD family reductase [Chloroflexota bacterium]MCI0786662.1 EthD family reductase [Chloroflexota bacterium]MCI0793373.1 EthD family reductase [Chloroflexota bacterium]
MIRVTVAYTNQEGKKFDWDYFTGTHAEIVHREMDSRGMVGFEQDKGISGADPSTPPPFVGMAFLTFNTLDEVHQAFMAVGGTVMGDIPNYTDIEPTIQISEIAG